MTENNKRLVAGSVVGAAAVVFLGMIFMAGFGLGYDSGMMDGIGKSIRGSDDMGTAEKPMERRGIEVTLCGGPHHNQSIHVDSLLPVLYFPIVDAPSLQAPLPGEPFPRIPMERHRYDYDEVRGEYVYMGRDKQ